MLDRRNEGYDDDLGGQLRFDCLILEQSGLFDAAAYRAAAGLSTDENATKHYLCEGWRRGIEPGPNFEGAFLYPYYHSVGFDGPPALTYLDLQAIGAATFATRASAEAVAALVRKSALFDAADYATRVGGIEHLDSALHYVIVGERMGYAPSNKFDPAYYIERDPAVARGAANALLHYTIFGVNEGRSTVSAAARLTFDTSRCDPSRETVLLFIHQASRTGAPILGYNIAKHLQRRYNVVAVLLAGGDLTADFQDVCAAVVGPLTYADWNPVDAHRLVQRLAASYRISYAIANTIDTRLVLKSLTLARIPVVAVIHEFSSYVPPKGEMGRALEWATQIIFSSEIVFNSARDEYPNLSNRIVHILRQGQVELPRPATSMLPSEKESPLRDVVRPISREKAFVVLGCGTLNIRKGVDIFVSCASAVLALLPRAAVRFVWIGAPTPTDMDRVYVLFLEEQIARAGLGNVVKILDEVADLGPAYDAADLFLLSSRLDPLPNVAIEAALRGLPVVCFENATGFAEILKQDSTTAKTIVPHLDAHAAACAIVKLIEDKSEYRKVSKATLKLARQAFDMKRYVEHLDAFGREAMELIRQRDRDFDTINSDGLFDICLALGGDSSINTREEAILYFLARAAAFGVGKYPMANFYYRRPCPGFHPQIYAHENAGRYDQSKINPLAHFIRSGKPEGAWRHDFIAPNDRDPVPPVGDRLRVALHCHLHYPELVEDFLRKLTVNQTRCDLLLSTTDESKAEFLRATTSRYGNGGVHIRVVPNRGRDIGSFLTEFYGFIDNYDIIGHVHGKRSLFLGESVLGETWREFLWQNLIGDLFPMMDRILSRLAEDATLGIVFAEDPHLSDWDTNREIATKFARKMGIELPLPPFFDFPVGTMFWARAPALKPLFDLKLGWDDYPEEPIPDDGTVLHAIERLLPFAARRAGYRYATTHIAGVTW